MGIVSSAWLEDMPFPPEKLTSSMNLIGFRAVSKNEPIWFSVAKDIMNEFTIKQLNVYLNGSLFGALIVSLILSGLISILILIAIAIAINKSYSSILDHLSNVDKYALIEKKKGF